MRRRPTYRETLYGQPPGADALARQWNDEQIQRLLGIIWDSYDDVYRAEWSRVDWTQDYDDLERELSEALAAAITERMDGFSPVSFMHGPSEREARAGGKAQPPEYDIAFRWKANPLLIWPLEAKVLRIYLKSIFYRLSSL